MKKRLKENSMLIILCVVMICCTVCVCNKVDESNSELGTIDYMIKDLPTYTQVSNIYDQLDFVQSDLDSIYTDINNIRQDVDDIGYKLGI